MNSRQISELFAHYETFNPIETFGNRQSATSNKRTQRQSRNIDQIKENNIIENKMSGNTKNKNKNSSSKGTKNNGIRSGQQELYQDSEKQQTRIRLLTSFQESYLQSISQPVFTQVDQGSNLKPSQSNDLCYSMSKKSDMRVDQYAQTDPNQYTYDQAFTLSQGHISNQKPLRQLQNHAQRNKKGQKIILGLKLCIEQEAYQLQIEERLYQYLMSRIDTRGESRMKKKKKDQHKIIEKAIDFMDCGEQFMMQLKKLSELQET